MKNNILEKYMKYPKYIKEIFYKLIEENIISCNKNFPYLINRPINIYSYLTIIDIINIIKNSYIIEYGEKYIICKNNKRSYNYSMILYNIEKFNIIKNN